MSNHFAVSLKDEKFPSGPIVSPNPGPILASAAAAPDKEVIRSSPVSESSKANIPRDAKNTTKNVTLDELPRSSRDSFESDSDSNESRDDRLNSPKSGIYCFCRFLAS